jgi:hypothetical protein
MRPALSQQSVSHGGPAARQGYNRILAGALIPITLNPLLSRAIGLLESPDTAHRAAYHGLRVSSSISTSRR